MQTRPTYYPETQEYHFNDRWYDANDEDDMDALKIEIEAAEDYEIERGDYMYHLWKDEGRF